MDSKLWYSRWKNRVRFVRSLFFLSVLFLPASSTCQVRNFLSISSQFWSSPFPFPFTTTMCWKTTEELQLWPLGWTGHRPKGKTEQIREARSFRPGHCGARHGMFSSFEPNILRSLFPFPVSCAYTGLSAWERQRCLTFAGESTQVYCPVDLQGYFA